MLKDSISKMNAAGPSGVVSKTVQAAGGGDYLERRNYTGQKLTDHIPKKLRELLRSWYSKRWKMTRCSLILC